MAGCEKEILAVIRAFAHCSPVRVLRFRNKIWTRCSLVLCCRRPDPKNAASPVAVIPAKAGIHVALMHP